MVATASEPARSPTASPSGCLLPEALAVMRATVDEVIEEEVDEAAVSRATRLAFERLGLLHRRARRSRRSGGVRSPTQLSAAGGAPPPLSAAAASQQHGA